VGYVTEGPQTTPEGPEFFAAVPAALPLAYVMFSMNSDPGPSGTDLTQEGIIEAVTKASTTQSAGLLLQKIEAAAAACGGGAGTSVAIPDAIPHLRAIESTSTTSTQSVASAEVLSQKGDYVIEVRWFNTDLANPTSPSLPSAPTLPTPQVVASIVDAALSRLPV
jgi:hypothetical protein